MGSFSHSFAGSELSAAGKWFGSFSHSISLRSFSRSLCVARCFGLSLRSFSHALIVLRDPEIN